jgi:polar amino acid transport system substrate-binding protein
MHRSLVVLLARVLAPVVVALPLVGLPIAAHADALDNIKKSGTLRVAVPQDFPPFGTVGPDLKPRGYDIDTAALLAKEMGVKLDLVAVTSTNRIPFLTTGKVDLVISSLGKNPDREKVIDFSNAYAPFFNGVFGPADMPVKEAKDLAGKVVGVTRGSVEDLELSKIVPPTTTVKRFEDNNSTIQAYLTGQVQLVATGNVVAASVNERTKLRRLDTRFLIKNSPCFVGLNKNEPALMAEVNRILEKSKKNGALEEISKKWLQAPLPKDL